MQSPGGVGLSGVNISLSSGVSTVSGEDGSYIFTEVPKGNYTITPFSGNYSFNPENRNVTVENAGVTGMDFTGSISIAETYTISGKVQSFGGVGLSGVSISLSSGASTVSGEDGSYSFTDVPKGNYTITPSSGKYTLNPDNINVTVDNANVSGMDFTGYVNVDGTYSISGKILGSDGVGISGINVSLSNGAWASTEQDGSYSFSGVHKGNYTISPTSGSYIFTPESRSVTIDNSDFNGMDFTGTFMVSETYSISGMLSSVNETKLAGITVNLSNGASVLTSQDGIYSFTGLTKGNYTITPNADSYTFNPESRSVTIGNADITDVNFTGINSNVNPTYSISGQILNGDGLGVSGVNVHLSNGYTGVTGDDGIYSFSELPNGTYTVTPIPSDFSFKPVSSQVIIDGANKTGINFTLTYAGTPN